MAYLKFRVYWEEDDAIYRDVIVKHTQHFTDLYHIILKAFEFDQKHSATFFRSNDKWQSGREITKEIYDKEYHMPPLIMDETIIGSEIIDTNQHFIFLYDFAKSWKFLIELIQVIKNGDANLSVDYPNVSRVEGVGPMQYGSKGLLGKTFADIEEKYDLGEDRDGFGEEGESHLKGDNSSEEETDEEDDDQSEDENNDNQDDDGSKGNGFFDSDAY